MNLSLFLVMRRVGITSLPLHHGECPAWLFSRMRKLARAIAQIIIMEYGKKEFLRRLSDPFFFQSLSCVLGFDWHSSGTTTVTCAALKEAIPQDFGIVICGGKGKASRNTVEEIEEHGEKFSLSTRKIEELKRASRLVAKVDNALVQDAHEIYHHSFIFSEDGDWAVIQQGMNVKRKTARRYHWISYNVESFVTEPHTAIVCEQKEKNVLNLVAKESEEVRKVSIDLIKDNPAHLKKYIIDAKQISLTTFLNEKVKYLSLPWRINWQALYRAYELQPKNYEELIEIRGIGPATTRALALVSKLIFGKEPSWKDPAKYSYAHGGKDGVPYRINTKRMEKTTEILEDAIRNAELGRREKIEALRRLSEFIR